jgi:hypothetical protein
MTTACGTGDVQLQVVESIQAYRFTSPISEIDNNVIDKIKMVTTCQMTTNLTALLNDSA